MRIDSDNTTRLTIWYTRYKNTGDMQIVTYQPIGMGDLVLGPYEVEIPTPRAVINDLEAHRLEAGINPAKKIAATSVKKTA